MYTKHNRNCLLEIFICFRAILEFYVYAHCSIIFPMGKSKNCLINNWLCKTSAKIKSLILFVPSTHTPSSNTFIDSWKIKQNQLIKYFLSLFSLQLPVTLCNLGVGATFGDSILHDLPRDSTVVTKTTCELLRVEQHDFRLIWEVSF